MQLLAGINFFRGIVQFFGKQGVFISSFRPKYATNLWCKVPNFNDYIFTPHMNIFPDVHMVQKCSPGYVVSSWDKFFPRNSAVFW